MATAEGISRAHAQLEPKPAGAHKHSWGDPTDSGMVIKPDTHKASSTQAALRTGMAVCIGVSVLLCGAIIAQLWAAYPSASSESQSLRDMPLLGPTAAVTALVTLIGFGLSLAHLFSRR